MKKKMSKRIYVFFLCLIAILISLAKYFKYDFTTNFDQIIYALKYGSGNADNSIYLAITLDLLPLIILIFIILYILFFDITFNKKKLIIKKKQVYPIKVLTSHPKLFTCILLIVPIILIASDIGLFDYIYNANKDSNLIEKNYVDPKKENIDFKEKRNLVFILVESLETTMFTKDQNGSWDYELIPEMYNLLNDEDSVVFYNNNKTETINMVEGSSWTTASVVSNLSGLPLKANLKNNIYDANGFMNKTYALGDLLKDNGYHNEVISGARASFGGIKEYFTSHGNYSIIDENSLKNYNLAMTKNDIGNWGFNDKYLFEVAKKRIDILAKKNEPFNIQLITIDTHFIDGFVGNYSVKKYNTRPENAFATESKLIYDFVEWIKSKDYYKNTTIVISGDHLIMQKSILKDKKVKKRYVYNCFINPRTKIAKNKKRIITSLDNYPTIVYAIGGDIKRDKLGLGTNLFSDQKTLAEKYGIEKFSTELKQHSDYYNNKILDS